MKLLIVESPNKIKTISSILGADYDIVASYGHIRDLSKNYKDGIGIDIRKDFDPKFAFMTDKVEVIQNLLDHAAKAEQVLIATDPDREGEAIGFHIYTAIKDSNKNIKRVSFDKITKDAVLNAVANPRDIDMNLVHSQISRRVLDRIVGFMVSPLLMNKYQQNLSAGRVQSVATRMIVEREGDIKRFTPKEYWNIVATLQKEGKFFQTKLTKEVSNEKEAKAIHEALLKPNTNTPTFEVVKVTASTKKEMPKPPLNTSRMQQIMSTRYGMDGEVCMEKAQSLYEKGLTTYIRTDSVNASSESIKCVREHLKKNGFEIPEKPHKHKDKKNSQAAHECIRPTKIELLPSQVQLHPDEVKLYKVIWECFVSSQMMPAIFDTLVVNIIHSESKLPFKTLGKALRSKGYLEFSNATLSEIDLPSFTEKDLLTLKDDKSISLEQKFTEPPSRFTYASLIKELDHRGVGRPSTFANICKTITSRSYVERKENTFYGTELGNEITSLLEKYFPFMEYNYTAKLEEQLDDIADGKISRSDVLTSFYKDFSKKINEAHVDNKGEICKVCNSPLYHKKSREGKEYRICSMSPYCRGGRG